MKIALKYRASQFGKWLGISSTTDAIRAIVFEALLTLAWWGISSLFNITIVREIGFLVVLVTGVFALTWYYTKRETVRITVDANRKSAQIANRPQRLEHDGVIWEQQGRGIDGPLCPKDFTPLCMKYGDNIQTIISDTFEISSFNIYRLYCLSCKTEYLLGERGKSTRQSMEEVRLLFEGAIKRGDG